MSGLIVTPWDEIGDEIDEHMRAYASGGIVHTIKPIIYGESTLQEEARKILDKRMKAHAETALAGAMMSTTASTSTMPALTAAELLAEMEKVEKAMSSMSAAPSWVQTTLDWIRENHPRFCARGFPTSRYTLISSLRRMSYLMRELQEAGTYTIDTYSIALQEKVRTWSERDFLNMKDFLRAGGYTPPEKVLKKPLAAAVTVEEATTEPPPEPVDQELDDAIGAELRALDERHGSW